VRGCPDTLVGGTHRAPGVRGAGSAVASPAGRTVFPGPLPSPD